MTEKALKPIKPFLNYEEQIPPQTDSATAQNHLLE